jgi:integrase
VGRTVKDVRLQDRAARARLPVSPDIYWRAINEGCHLGYYRGTRGGKWVVRYRKPGAATGYVKVRIGEADDVRDADGDAVLDWKQAQAKAHRWFDEQARGGAKPAGPFTVAIALDEYIEGFRSKSGSVPVDLRSRVDAIIRPALGHYEVADLTAKIIGAWHQGRAKSPAQLRTRKGAEEQNQRKVEGTDAVRRRRSTANRDLTVLKAALNRAAEHRDDLPVAAWAKVKPFPNVDAAKRRFLTDDEARRLINVVEEEFRPIAKAALLTGGRYGELRHTRVRDYDRQSRTLFFTETKGVVSRPAYLDDEGVEMLDQATAGKGADEFIFLRPDGRQWDRSHQLRRMEEAFERAKIARTTFHDLRRSYGARLARKGVPMAVIAEAMGHKDERITRKHYAHLAPSYVSETVRAAVTGLGIVERSNVTMLGRDQ